MYMRAWCGSGEVRVLRSNSAGSRCKSVGGITQAAAIQLHFMQHVLVCAEWHDGTIPLLNPRELRKVETHGPLDTDVARTARRQVIQRMKEREKLPKWQTRTRTTFNP